MSPTTLLWALLLPCAAAVSTLPGCRLSAIARPAVGRLIRCSAIDYNDPEVAEEFGKVQVMPFEEIEEELGMTGIIPPPTMSEMDVRLMLVEMRMRKAGKVGSKKQASPPKPASFANAFEEALYEKPAFKELISGYQASRDTNALNLASEYLNNKARAKERYGGTTRYDETVAAIEEALNAKVVRVATSGKLTFSGFPANMGEAGIRMAFEAFGPLKELSVEESDDGLSCSGQAEFEGAEEAQSAMDKYDGMDMGLGNKLEMIPA